MICWDKFSLLMWKNWKLQIRRPISFVIEIVIPIFVLFLVVFIKTKVSNEDWPENKYINLPLKDISSSLPIGSAYSPNTNEFVKNLMEINFPGIKGTKNEDEMQTYIMDFVNKSSDDYTFTYVVGIQFDEDLDPKNPKKFNINIRYGDKMRSSYWQTESIYPDDTNFKFGTRSYGQDYGGPPSYHSHNFDSIMYTLTKKILETTNPGKTLPALNARRFPDPAYHEDRLIEQLSTSFGFGMMFMAAFVYSSTNTVKCITLEKEKQLKEAMKIMGLPTWLHWTAWFFQIIIPLFIVAILYTVGLKFEWSTGQIFEKTNWSLIFAFFLFYVLATITFCFAMSTFFTKANRAASLTGIGWIFSLVPYIIVRTTNYNSIGAFMKYFTSLSITSAMAYGCDLITIFEVRGKGVQWNNIFETSPANNISFGGILLMMIFDCLLYLLIALYVEQVYPGQFGVPQKWYFFVTPEFWGVKKNFYDDDRSSLLQNDGEFFEKEPTNLNVGIKIAKLSKTFGSNVAVRELSLNLYENQITVLLGHNGAGKTTTMSMLTGMFPPTSGTAYVNGYDVRTQIMNVRDSMGLCPQHNVLFDDLTVSEHLKFFSKLKGCKGNEVDEEIEKFLKLLNLEDKADKRSKSLSGGMKRKLSVGIALCGHSKVIMLDEPTAGMDPTARRFMWEFLQKQKKDRTILLTTHFMDEADLLGDRIAIMSVGELKCCGSSFFLKKKYGTGYHLIVDQTEDCRPDQITAILRKYIPNIEIESNAGTELTYLLPEKYSPHFPELLSKIEERSTYLGVRSFGISLTNLEEVFMKVGTNETGKVIMKEDNHNHHHTNGFTTNVTIDDRNLETGFSLLRNQIRAMVMKKFISTKRSWMVEVLKSLLPVILIVILLYTTDSLFSDAKSRDFSLGDYDEPVILVEDNPNNANYLNMLNSMKQKYEITSDVPSRVTQLMKEDSINVKYKYVVAASFSDSDGPTAWFHNEPFHTVPLTVQLMLKSYLSGTGIDVNFVNNPIPKNINESTLRIIKANVIVLAFSYAIVFIGNFYILFLIRERMSQAKHLQFVSGINLFVFWFTSFVMDFLTYLVPLICIMITFSIIRPDGLSTASSLFHLSYILFVFGFAVIPFMYLFSYLFTVPSTAYSRLFFVGFISSYPMFMIVRVLYAVDWGCTNVLQVFLRLIPQYSFIDALCSLLIPEGSFDLKVDKTADIITSYFVCFLCFLVIFMVDFKIFITMKYKMFPLKTSPIIQPEIVDEDVRHEILKVENTDLDQLQNENVLVLKNLTKKYKKFTAVNGLNLTVKRSECFGLLGVNGAGKTTTFKMLTGDVMITYGDGWIKGFSIKNQMKQVHKYIGYCPQFDALLDNLTARETIVIFALIRGVPKGDCDSLAEKMARDFDFQQHLDKQVKELSGGNKRKLSTTIALIGDAPIIFLDEPTTGMDPATKRHLWNRLSSIRESGKSIILTSHSMEECEALCTRLVIMVNGNFQCLGSIQHLKSRFADGFSITIKTRKPENSSGFDHSDTREIEQFMLAHFPHAELAEKHQELLTYYIKDNAAIKWSKLFAIMERAKNELNIEDYSVGQASLEQVFLKFTKYQVSTEDSRDKKKKRKFCCC